MSKESPLQTPLHAWHVAHGGRMVDFGGWSMPLQYSTIIEEHRAVRERVGLFDVSHMGRLHFEGPGALDWLERATTNHVAKLEVGKIQYSLMANDRGGVIDDLLVYRLPEPEPQPSFGVVCNAGNREKVIRRFEELKGEANAQLTDQTQDLAMIAVQGPAALEVLARVVDAPLGSTNYYQLTRGTIPTLNGAPVWASRTGYTGEDGFEVMLPSDLAESFWQSLIDSGADREIRPCGLASRDTLRFEAALPLYGHELSEDLNPYEAGVGWTVKLSKGDFAGREALQAFKRNPGRTRVGLALEGKRIARQGASVLRDGKPIGIVTSGTFSPTLERSLAMALVDPTAAGIDTSVSLDIRGRQEPARVVALPFYRRVGA